MSFEGSNIQERLKEWRDLYQDRNSTYRAQNGDSEEEKHRLICNFLIFLEKSGESTLKPPNKNKKGWAKVFEKLKWLLGLRMVEPKEQESSPNHDASFYNKMYSQYLSECTKCLPDELAQVLPTEEELSVVIQEICGNPKCFQSPFADANSTDELKYDDMPDFLKQLVKQSYHQLSIQAKNLFLNILLVASPNITVAMVKNHFIMEMFYSIMTNYNQGDGGFILMVFEALVGQLKHRQAEFRDFLALLDQQQKFYHGTDFLTGQKRSKNGKVKNGNSDVKFYTLKLSELGNEVNDDSSSVLNDNVMRLKTSEVCLVLQLAENKVGPKQSSERGVGRGEGGGLASASTSQKETTTSGLSISTDKVSTSKRDPY